MRKKSTTHIYPGNKKFIDDTARPQSNSGSEFIDTLFESVKSKIVTSEIEDEWIIKTAGSYSSGKKVRKDLLKGKMSS